MYIRFEEGSASDEDMKKAYHKAVRETHPDKTGCDSEDEFREVQEAYEYYTTLHDLDYLQILIRFDLSI